MSKKIENLMVEIKEDWDSLKSVVDDNLFQEIKSGRKIKCEASIREALLRFGLTLDCFMEERELIKSKQKKLKYEKAFNKSRKKILKF